MSEIAIKYCSKIPDRNYAVITLFDNVALCTESECNISVCAFKNPIKVKR